MWKKRYTIFLSLTNTVGTRNTVYKITYILYVLI